jgi:hypothetical protein
MQLVARLRVRPSPAGEGSFVELQPAMTQGGTSCSALVAGDRPVDSQPRQGAAGKRSGPGPRRQPATGSSSPARGSTSSLLRVVQAPGVVGGPVRRPRALR